MITEIRKKGDMNKKEGEMSGDGAARRRERVRQCGEARFISTPAPRGLARVGLKGPGADAAAPSPRQGCPVHDSPTSTSTKV